MVIFNIQHNNMFRIIAILSVAGFIPSQASRISSRSSSSSSLSLKMSFEREAGVTAPLGYFDPLGLANVQDTFDQYHASKLKHGRVAQLAVLGYIVPQLFNFPGEIAPGISFASIPNDITAIDAVPYLGWLQIILIGSVDNFGFFLLWDQYTEVY